METFETLEAPREQRDQLISKLTVESIAFAALNARCKRVTHEGLILDSGLASEKKDSLNYIDRLLDKMNEADPPEDDPETTTGGWEQEPIDVRGTE